MAELFLRTDDGKEVPLEKVEGLDNGKITVVRVNTHLRPADVSTYEKELSIKFDRKVIVLDLRFGEILSIKE